MVRFFFILLLFINLTSHSQGKIKLDEDSIYRNSLSQEMKKLESKDFLGAIKIWTDYISLNPSDIRGYAQRSFIYSQVMKDYKSAIEDETKIIELRQYNYDGDFYSRGGLKADMGDYTGAILDLTKAIEINSYNKFNYASRAKIKSKLEDYRGAIEDFNIAIAIWEKELNENPLLKNSLSLQNVNYYFDLAICKARLSDFRGAIESLNKAINFDSKDSLAFYYRGLARVKIGEKNEGCLDFSKAGELGYVKAYDAIKLYCK